MTGWDWATIFDCLLTTTAVVVVVGLFAYLVTTI